MDCQNWIKEVGQSYAVGFGHQPEEGPVTVETPRPALIDYFEVGFVVSVNQFVGYSSGRRLIGEF